MGRDEEGGRTVELFHRGPAYPAPLLAVARHRLLHVRLDDRPIDQPRTPRVASAGLRLGRHLPACGRGWQSHPLSDRAQPMVDDLLVLIADLSIFMDHFSTFRAYCPAGYRVARTDAIFRTLTFYNRTSSRNLFYILVGVCSLSSKLT